MLSFPLGGNVCDKPLDSGLRRNDGGGDRDIRATFNTVTFILLFDLTQPRTGIPGFILYRSLNFLPLFSTLSLPSFRRRPESSGLDNPFPPGGNALIDSMGISLRPARGRRPE